RVVLGDVAGDADEQVLVRGELGRQAGRRHILVVVFAAGGQVLAEAVALEAGEGAADARRFRNRSAGGGDDLFLAVFADGGAQARVGFRGQLAGHVLDGAADGVAAVQRALRAAQHFDAFDVVDVG